MPSPTDQLLLRFGIDMRPAQQAMDAIRSGLLALKQYSDNLVNTTAQGSRDVAAALSQIQSALGQNVQASREAQQVERDKLDVVKQTGDAYNQHKSALSDVVMNAKQALDAERLRKAELQSATQELQRQTAEHRAMTAEIQKQMAEIRRTRLEEGGSEKKGGGIGGRLLQGVLGQGIAGSVVGGILAGEGIAAAVEGVSKLIEKFKELVVESGQMADVEDVFERIAKGAGVNATKAIEGLQEATEGTVPKIELLRLGISGLQRGVPVERIQQMAHAITTLVESGTTPVHSVTQAMQDLNRAIQTGNALFVARALGIERGVIATRGMAAGLSQIERDSISLNQFYAELIRKADQVGDTPKTIESAMSRLKIAITDVVESFGAGLQRSAGFQDFLTSVNATVMSLLRMEKQAEQFGVVVGNALAPVLIAMKDLAGPTLDAVGAGFRNIFGIIGDLAAPIAGVSAAVGGLNENAQATKGSFADLHPVLTSIIKTTLLMQLEFLKVALAIETVTGKFREWVSNPIVAQALLGTAIGAKAGGAPGAVAGGVAGAVTGSAEYGLQNTGTTGQIADLVFKAALSKMPGQGKTAAAVQSRLSSSVSGYQPQGPMLENEEAAADPQTAALLRGISSIQKAITDLETTAVSTTSGKAIKPGGPNIPNPQALQLQLREEEKALKDQMELETKTGAARLAEQEARIKKAQQEDELGYEKAEETLKQHLATQRELEAQLYDAQRGKAVSDYQAKVTEQRGLEGVITQKVAAGLMKPDIAQQERKDTETKIQSAAQDLARALIDIAMQRNAKVAQLDKAEAADEISTAKKTAEDVLALEKKKSEGRIKEIESQLKASEEAVKADQQLNEKRLGQGQISPDVFYKNQIADIDKLADAQKTAAVEVAALKIAQAQAEITAANILAAATKQNDTEHEDALGKIQRADEAASQAQIEAQTKIDQAETTRKDHQAVIDEEQAQKRLSSLKNFQLEQQSLQAQLSLRGQYGALSGEDDPTIIIKKLLASVQAEQQALIAQANQLTMEGGAFSDTWFQIYDRVQKSYDTVVQLTQKLHEAADLAPAIGGVFSVLGAGISASLPSKEMQSIGQSLSAGAKALAAAPQRARVLSGAGVEKSPEMLALETQATSLFDKARTAAMIVVDPMARVASAANAAADGLFKLAAPTGEGPTGEALPTAGLTPGAAGPTAAQIKLGAQVAASAPGAEGVTETHSGPGGASGDFGGETSGGSWAQTITQFTAKLQAGVGALTDFVSTVLNSKNAIAGAAGGATAGAGLGQAAGGVAHAVFGASDAAGPIGSLIGALGGALLGGIIGNKNQQIQNMLNDFQSKMQWVMQEYALNNNNLQQTIVQLLVLRAAVQAEASAQKKGKGSAAFTQQINQINQQIMQLEAQQEQILVNMNEQLAILSAPVGMQQYLQTLQQILQQYDQFAGAAQNTQQLAQANQFLVESLQQYALTLQTQLNTDDQNAINNALQLNDLYNQRIDLVNQMNTQIEGVLSAGVLSRTPTRAMTAGQQIEQIQFTGQNQLDQLNEQIAADQFSLQAAQQVFNLATTRIGLEMQLLQLQNAQTALQMTQISSLAQLVQALQSGNYSLLGPLLAAMPGYQNPVTGSAVPPAALGNQVNFPISPGDLANLIAGVTGGSGAVPSLTATDLVNGLAQLINQNPSAGVNLTEALFSAAYQTRATQGYAGIRGQNV